MDEPRNFDDLGQHARAVQEQAAIAQGGGYIVGVGYPIVDQFPRPVLPGFRPHLSHGSQNLRARGEHVRWETFNAVCDHVRFLEHTVERLAAQLAEMAERLALDPAEVS